MIFVSTSVSNTLASLKFDHWNKLPLLLMLKDFAHIDHSQGRRFQDEFRGSYINLSGLLVKLRGF